MRQSVFPKQFEFGYSARSCTTMGWANPTRKSWIKYWGKWIRQWENPYPSEAGGLAWTGGWLWPETRLHTFTVDVASGDGVWDGDPTPVQRSKALRRHHTRKGGSIKGRLHFADSCQSRWQTICCDEQERVQVANIPRTSTVARVVYVQTPSGGCVMAVPWLFHHCQLVMCMVCKSAKAGAVGVRVFGDITNTAGTLETNRNWFNEDTTRTWRTNPNWFNEV